MPEPPADLGRAARQRLGQVQQSGARVAQAQAELPPAETQVGGARAAVTEPPEETAARAEADLVAALGAEPPPSPELEELCQRIYQVIRSKRPPDEEQLVKAEPEQMAQSAGAEMNASIEGDVQRVGGEYQGLQENPQGQPQQVGGDLNPPPEADAPAPAAAAAAAPDAVPAENVSLEADVAANEARMQEAGMMSEPAQLVQTGPIAEGRAAHEELQATAEADPAAVLGQQQESLAGARAEMASLQQQALAALTASRTTTAAGTHGRQRNMVMTEAQKRADVSRQAREIFESTQTTVRGLLQPLARNALDEWDKEVAVLSTQFKSRLRRVEDWIKERHSGGWGTVVSIWDDITGLPGWVVDEYDAAEQAFGDGVCAVVRRISRQVNQVIATCEQLITSADQRIAALFAGLEPGLQSWAAEEQARFQEQLAGLRNEAHQTRDNFNRDLAQRAGQAVQDVREQIHALREKAKGMIGRAIDAINRFLEDPAKAILEGLLSLLGIPPAAFWAVVNRIQEVISDIADDPEKFANNLMEAVGQGFSQFFDNIGTHLLQGLLDWLLSGLTSAGVELPKDFSLKSIITFFLQLMGISWPRIRQLLVKHIGEENVALIEKAWSVVSTLIEQGPAGIFEMIKDKLNPREILDQVLEAAKDYLIESLIKAVTARIIALFNPVGAIVQAIEAIYRVLKWIFTNAARIFRLIETIVNGIHDILQGNIGGMAAAVEKALAGLIPPVIDFLADYLGFGDLPEKIRETIEGFQAWVEGILDKVIGWLVEKGKALLQAIGLGKEGEEGAEAGEYDGEVGKVVTFSAGGESHRIRVVMQGTDAVVLMASEEKPLTEHLDDYQQQAEALEDAEKKSKVLGLIGEARQLLADTDTKADTAADKATDAETKPDETKAADDAVESGEDRLAATVRKIQEELGLETPLTETEKDGAKTKAGNLLDLIRPDGWYGKAAEATDILTNRSNETPSGPMGPHVAYKGRKRSNGQVILGLIQGRSALSDYGKTWRRQQSIPQDHHIASDKGTTYNFTNHPAFATSGLSIQDPENIIALHGHAGSHSSSYHEEVKAELDAAVRRAGGPGLARLKDEVIQALRRLRARILAGTLKLYGDKEVYV